MTPENFTYWLSGVLQTNTHLDKDKTDILKDTLESVDIHEQDKGFYFCLWLQGYMEIAAPEEINASALERIQGNLNIQMQVNHSQKSNSAFERMSNRNDPQPPNNPFVKAMC